MPARIPQARICAAEAGYLFPADLPTCAFAIHRGCMSWNRHERMSDNEGRAELLTSSLPEGRGFLPGGASRLPSTGSCCSPLNAPFI
jgi:hypothetical protein